MTKSTQYQTFGPFPYSGPVSRDEFPPAHGGVCYRDVTSTGQTRWRNVNGRHIEVGPWQHEDHEPGQIIDP